MSDEQFVIAVTDDGTIDQMVALLQLLGLTAEEASQRAAGGFTNLSTSQEVAAAGTRIMGAAANAAFGDVSALGDATDKLTTAEQKATTTKEGLARLTALLAEAQANGLSSALQLSASMDAQASASARSAEALTVQGDAVQGLTRLQQNLLDRQQALDNAYLTQIATVNSATTAQNNAQAALSASTRGYTDALTALNAYERAQVQLGISIQGLAGVYGAQDTLFGAQANEAAAAARELASLGDTATRTAGTFAALDRAQAATAASAEAAAGSFSAMATAATERLSSTTALAAADDALVAADQRAAAAIEEFIALQRECNTSTIAGREAIAQASAAYTTAVDAIGAYNVELELVASDQGKLADSAIKMADSLRAAAAAAVELGAAEDVAAKQAAVMEAAMVQIKSVGSELNSTFGGLNAIFAGAFATKELVDASDQFTKIQVTLGTVTKSTAELNSVYSQLHTIANDTQTSIEQNAKTFVQLSDATKGTGVSTDQLVQAVSGLDAALKIANVTGQDAYRVQRTIQEALSTTSGSAERFFQNLQRESPAAFALFNQAAKDAGVSMTEFGGNNDKAGQKVEALQTKLDGLEAKLGPHKASVQADSNAMTESAAAYQKAADALLPYQTALQNGTGLTAAQTKEYNKLNDTVAAQSVKYDTAKAAYNSAKAAQDSNTEAQIKATQAKLNDAEAQSDATKRVQDFVRILDQLAINNLSTAQTFTTVKGSIEVLKNNLVDFAGTSSTANASITILKDTILLAASNINIIIPAIIAFGAAIAVLKIAQTAQQLAELTANVVKFGGAFLAANAPVIAFAAVVVGLVVVFEKLANAMHLTNEPIDTFGTIAAAAGKAADGFGAIVGALSDKITQSAIHTANASAATKALSDAHGNASDAVAKLSGAVGTTDDQIVKYTGHVSAASQGLSANSTVTSQASKDYIAAQKAIADASAALDANRTAAQAAAAQAAATASEVSNYQQHVDTAKASQDKLNESIKAAPSLWSTLGDAISAVISKLASFISSAAQAATSAAKSLLGGGSSTATPAVAGHARNGGSFTVAGTGPVDSKLIAVSPGEVVTVQTPAQYRDGVAPPRTAGQTHFATGGVTVGAGVDFGSGIALGAAPDPNAAPTSVVGYSQDSTANAEAVTVTTENTKAVNDNTAAVNSSVTALNGKSTASTTASVTAPSTATTAAPSNGVTAEALINDAAARRSGENALAATEARNATPAASTTTSTTTTSTTARGTEADLEAGKRNPDGSITGPSGDVYRATTTAQYGPAVLGGSQITGYQDSFGNVLKGGGGSSVSNSPSYVISAQYKAQNDNETAQAAASAKATAAQYDAFTVSLPGGLFKLDPSTGQTASVSDIEAAKAAAQNLVDETAKKQAIHARDGADFFVPGGTGVDSKNINLAVSPGEQVTVRTPPQQREAPSQPGNTILNMYVSTPDASSFGNSQDQINNKLARGIRRANRR